MAESWKCYAKPAALGGRVCGHENARGVRFNGSLCCEQCGATKVASDARRAALSAEGSSKR